jgi:hypothetical protein
LKGILKRKRDAGLSGLHTDGLKEPKKHVFVLLKDTFQGRNHEVFIRYAVRNGTRKAYTLAAPGVFALKVDGVPNDFERRVNSQIGDAATAEIDTEQTPIDIVTAKLRSARLEPGQETVGVVGIKLPVAKTGPTVIRLVFPADGKHQPTATLVL